MNLSELEKLLKNQKQAPVELWNPPYCGEMDMLLKSDGSWWHQGSPILRHNLVKLFSRIIKKESEKYFLVTPVEKFAIQVEDAPFLAIDFQQVEDKQQPNPWLVFETNVGDLVQLNQKHALVLKAAPANSDTQQPYIQVRANLEAKLARSVFYHLVELGEIYQKNNQQRLRVPSGSYWFDLGAIE
ncbi:MAG: proteophosphoglycan precursor [Gammaproteobacteria bacterium CG22_combo_CG10-13_8_21_14_all_40_8]|nr:MAG: proteophosphoglycan precursor [Gammaproteobacteria bacterium CG22_combo_CG10-13_8_21_14_all_40_8]